MTDTTIKPWQWGTLAGRSKPVEVVSYPDPDGTVLVRMTPGDPTTMREVPAKFLACFEPSRHEDFYK